MRDLEESSSIECPSFSSIQVLKRVARNNGLKLVWGLKSTLWFSTRLAPATCANPALLSSWELPSLQLGIWNMDCCCGHTIYINANTHFYMVFIVVCVPCCLLVACLFNIIS